MYGKKRVCKTHGWTVNEGKGAVAYQRVMSIWDALKKVDADGDGTVIRSQSFNTILMTECFMDCQVDQEEWCTMWNNLAQGQGSQEWQEKYRDVIFSQIDTSGTIQIKLNFIDKFKFHRNQQVREPSKRTSSSLWLPSTEHRQAIALKLSNE